MEPDFHRQLGADCAISTDRMFQVNVTRDAEAAMLEEEFPRALRLIKTTAPHVSVFGCTSAGSLGGLRHDARIAERIQQQTGAHGVTVLAAVVEELRAIAPAKVAVFTPYEEDLTRSVAECVIEAGYEVVRASGMGMVDNQEIGRVTPAEILSFVERQMSGVNPDCIFLSCTNWQAIDAISPMTARFGLPVISSNQAAIVAVRKLLEKRDAANRI